MNKQDAERFGMSIAALAAAFSREIDQATLQAYRWGTEGMTAEAIEAACIVAIKTSQRMPSPAELRELGGEVSPKSMALLAWESFRQAVKGHGGNTSIDFEDLTINAVVRNLGGWREITLLAGEEFHKWLRHRFLDAYEKLSRLNLTGDVVGPLIGDLDTNNGFGKSEPIRFECLSSQRADVRPQIGNPGNADQIKKLTQEIGRM